jgi:hypothetical protein
MPRIFSEQQDPQALLRHCGVAIRNVGGSYRHVGILYSQDGQWRLLHLAAHRKLCDDPMPMPGARHLWINLEPAVEEARLESFAAYCRLIWQRNSDGGLPYAFSSPVNWFDANGVLVIQTIDGVGLTCSSFVLAVFLAAKLPLLNEDTWIVREDDREWQQTVTALVEQSGAATPEHIRLMRQSIPAIRYRPEEVAAAAASDPIPVDFTPCIALADEILRMLRQA